MRKRLTHNSCVNLFHISHFPFLISLVLCYFPTQRLTEAYLHMLLVVGILTQQAHHLGDGGLDGYVAGTDDADTVHITAGGILAHLDGAGLALGHIEDDDTAAYGVVEGRDKPLVGGRIARAVGLDDDAL